MTSLTVSPAFTRPPPPSSGDVSSATAPVTGLLPSYWLTASPAVLAGIVRRRCRSQPVDGKVGSVGKVGRVGSVGVVMSGVDPSSTPTLTVPPVERRGVRAGILAGVADANIAATSPGAVPVLPVVLSVFSTPVLLVTA